MRSTKICFRWKPKLRREIDRWVRPASKIKYYIPIGRKRDPIPQIKNKQKKNMVKIMVEEGFGNISRSIQIELWWIETAVRKGYNTSIAVVSHNWDGIHQTTQFYNLQIELGWKDRGGIELSKKAMKLLKEGKERETTTTIERTKINITFPWTKIVQTIKAKRN